MASLLSLQSTLLQLCMLRCFSFIVALQTASYLQDRSPRQASHGAGVLASGRQEPAQKDALISWTLVSVAKDKAAPDAGVNVLTQVCIKHCLLRYSGLMA